MNRALETTWLQQPLRFRYVVAHELGHLLGLGHVGNDDSDEQQIPMMATCSATVVGLAQDDVAGVNGLTNPYFQYRSVTANSSYEDGSDHWTYGSSTMVPVFGGGSSSTRYILLSPVGNIFWPNMYNTTRLADNQGQTLDAISARTHARNSFSSYTGFIEIHATVSPVDYPNGSTCGTPDYYSASGVQQVINSGPPVVNWGSLSAVKFCTPGTTWSSCGTADLDPSAVFGPQDAWDVNVGVFSIMWNGTSANRVAVAFDRTSVVADY